MAAMEDRLDTSKIAFAATAIAMVIVVIVVGLVVLYRTAQNDLFQTRVVDRPERAFMDLKSAQQGQLSSYSWVDRKAGVAAIPIDRAMQLVVDEQNPAQDDMVPDTREAPHAP